MLPCGSSRPLLVSRFPRPYFGLIFEIRHCQRNNPQDDTTLSQGEGSKMRQGLACPTVCSIIVTNNSDLSLLTGNNNNHPATLTARMKMASLGSINPKPKRKQIRPTASTFHQRHVRNLVAKRHKSNVHNVAVRLYDAKKQKLNGMSIWQVQTAITANTKCAPALQ
jgi:hypothetical protein